MDELIERKKVLEILRIIGHGRPISGKRAISLISEMPSASMWIPCSERMPEVGIPVLIYDKHHKAFFVAKLDEDYFGFSSNMWHHPADVPFWMPLPETPKEDGNEGF